MGRGRLARLIVCAASEVARGGVAGLQRVDYGPAAPGMELATSSYAGGGRPDGCFSRRWLGVVDPGIPRPVLELPVERVVENDGGPERWP